MPGHSSKKQSQRTKGNVRPSSSSQAAQLLTASGGAQPGLIGFGTLTGGPAFVPVSSTLDDADTSLDSDFRIVLRKLAKKDSTTKIKALQEFGALCKEKDEETVKGILPYWPRIYNRMALDFESRVRETTQNSMNCLVLRVRRSLAPHLKTLMGSWLLCQCDTYPTVATAALQSFQSAFPPAKQVDALVYCKQESVQFLVDNIVNQTSSTLSDVSCTEAKDRESKYNRVVSSSLLALRKLMVTIPADQQTSIVEQLTLLLDSAKFWKFGKSDVQTIRSSMFSFLSGLCEMQSSVAREYSSKLSPFVLHAIDEKEPSLCYYVWECVLSVTKNIEDSWSHVNLQKAFWPKLKALLENGCYGNAVVIGPNLLPLLSQIPVEKMPRPDTFYEDLFACMKLGISQDRVQASTSECNALVLAWMECLQFSVNKLSTASPDVTSHLILDQVLPLVQTSLCESSASLYRSSLYGKMASLVSNLEITDCAQLDELSSNYWNQLAIFIKEKLETEQSSAACNKLTERVVYLVRCIIYPETGLKSKSEKVKFECEINDSDANSVSDSLKKKRVLSKGTELFLQKILLDSFLQAYNHWSVEHLKLFSQIVELEVTDNTMRDIVECYPGHEVSDQTPSDQFAFNVCLPWLSKLQGTTQSQEGIKYLINIVCTFISSFEKSSSLILLEKLCESLTDLDAFHVLLEKVLQSHKSLPAVKEWLKSEKLGEKLICTIKEVCQLSMATSPVEEERIVHGWNIISLVLSAADDADPAVDRDHIHQILSTIHQSLLSLANSRSTDRVNTSIKFVSQAAHNFFSSLKCCLMLPAAGDLLLALFTICLDSSYDITDETLELCRSACLCGVHGLAQCTGVFLQDGVLPKIFDLIKQQVTVTNNMKGFDSVMLMAGRVVETLQESLTADVITEEVFEEMYICTDISVSHEVFVYLTMSGQFTSLKFQKNKQDPDKNSLMVMIICSLFNTSLLEMASPVQTEDNQPLDLEDNRLFQQVHVLIKSIAVMSLAKIWMKMEDQTSKISDVATGTGRLSTMLYSLVSRMQKKEKSALLNTAVKRCEDDCCAWTLCLQELLQMVVVPGDVILDLMLILERCHTLTDHNVQLLQCVVPHATLNDCLALSEIMVARLLSCGMKHIASVDGCLGPLSVLTKCLPHLLKKMESETRELVKGTLSQIMSWREESDTVFIFSSDLRESSDELVLVNVLVAEILELIVRELPHILTDKEWDFLLCSMVSWIQTIQESSSPSSHNSLVQIFSNQACRLLGEVAVFMRDKLLLNPSAFPQSLMTEWQEFFSESAFGILNAHFVKRVCELKNRTTEPAENIILQSMGGAIAFCPAQHILEHHLPPNFIVGELTLFPESYQTVLNHLCPMLIHTNRSVQTTVFWLLKSVMPELPQYDKEETELDSTDSDEQTLRAPPVCLLKIMDQAAVAMEIVLTGIAVDECLPIQPHTGDYQYSMAYLLVWKLFLIFFQSSPAELRQEYAAYLRKNGNIGKLMPYLYALMPSNPTSRTVSDMENKPVVTDEPSETEIQNLACSVYHQTLQVMPAMVRQWWKEQDRKTASYVDKFTSKHTSPSLCKAELQTVPSSDVHLENMTVKARLTTREVIATYSLEEVSIEIVITMPSNYPLGSISVQSEKRVGVSAGQWDKWLLQLNIFLQHQNGSIMEGLKLWKRNIDKRFEGVDDCMICFSVLHGTNFQLPRLTCRTCKKKFHSACLYKWFSTSNNSTCPMCRNLF